jgi:hypothetical protein
MKCPLFSTLLGIGYTLQETRRGADGLHVPCNPIRSRLKIHKRPIGAQSSTGLSVVFLEDDSGILSDHAGLEVASTSTEYQFGFGPQNLLLSLDAPHPEENLSLLFVGLTLMAAAGIFAFVNLVLTPEIVEGASKLRQERREREVRKLIDAVTEKGDSILELREPLEAALGVSLEEYVEGLNNLQNGGSIESGSVESPTVVAADFELGAIIKSALQEKR